MQSVVVVSAAGEAAPSRVKIAAFTELTKPGITRLVVLTTGAGFYLGSHASIDFPRFFATLIGTALVASGTSALNQYVERDLDALMRRTSGRPLPSGRLTPREALVFSTTLAIAGLAVLLFAVNVLTTLVVAATLVSYLFIYTPMKRVTSLSTLVGAVPGALPILAGWTASGAPLTTGAWSLFWILFLWQIPHFLALAWIYREDYQRGGFRMLTLTDPDGHRTGRQSFIYALALVPVSMLPTLAGITGPFYFAAAFGLGAMLVVMSARLMLKRSLIDARRLFLASVIYLPILLILMVVDATSH
jgi:protoheme IX farnesyltransferase